MADRPASCSACGRPLMIAGKLAVCSGRRCGLLPDSCECGPLDPVDVALGLVPDGDVPDGDVPDGDVLAALKTAVGKAEPDDQPAVAARMVQAMAAGMDDAARLAARGWIKQRKLFPVAEFDKLADRRRHVHFPPGHPSAEHAHLHTPPSLASDQDILGRAVVCMGVCMGLVGEQRTAQLEYLMLTSRLLAKPVSGVVKGLSSTGKSFTTECVVALFPAEATLVMTAMSERALIYLADDLAHRTVVLYEAVALREGREKTDDNQTAYIVRSLLSEGQIRYPVVVRDGDGPPRTEWVIKEGPTNLLTTTTSVSLHAENETRVLSLPSDDSEAQTARVLLGECDDGDRPEPDLEPWHQLQCWLAQARHEVVIPFDKCIAAQIPPKAARLRRDWRSVRSLIRAHAMLHQLSRETDDRGRVIATIGDYAVVHGLVAEIVAEAVGATVPASVRETVEVVADRQQRAGTAFEGVKVAEIARTLHIERSAAQRRVQAARDRGYLDNLEDKRGRPGRYVPGDADARRDRRAALAGSGVHRAVVRAPGAHPRAHQAAHVNPQVSGQPGGGCAGVHAQRRGGPEGSGSDTSEGDTS